MDVPAMQTRTAAPFVDTNIIPDRNAGIGSLLWDLQDSPDPEHDEPPLLGPEFAFIDVGASRARTATTLKTLLAEDLGMAVDYVATELPEGVPSAHVTPLGDRAQRIRRLLSAMISSGETPREVTEWHYVIDREGKVASVAYSYPLHGNEVWEAYFMGRAFLVSGERVEFRDPALEEMLAPDVQKIEAEIERERKQGRDASKPAPSWDGYRVERDPLEAGLAEFGIRLQTTDVPRRIEGRQNVLFLGNVLNHYPQEERAPALDRIAANMQEGDLVIVQADEVESSFVEVLHVRGHGTRKSLERVRWIDTRTLEVQALVRGAGSWRQVPLKPELDRMAARLADCLERKARSPEWSHEDHRAFVRRQIRQVFRTYLRALPVEATFRVVARQALRRLPAEVCPKGIPVFADDANDACGGTLGVHPGSIVSAEDLVDFGLGNPKGRRGGRPGSRRREIVRAGSEPMITITEYALKWILESRERLGLPVKGIRVNAIPRSPMRADFSMRFVPAEEPDSPTDTIHAVDGIDLYIAPDSAPYLEGATIDYVFRIVGSELTVIAPPRKQDTPEGRIAARVHQVLEEEVNPSLATHGGGANLIDFKDGILSLELTGGCQGCSAAGATLKDGIETSIRLSVPEVQEIRDVTRHAQGKNPYYQ